MLTFLTLTLLGVTGVTGGRISETFEMIIEDVEPPRAETIEDLEPPRAVTIEDKEPPRAVTIEDKEPPRVVTEMPEDSTDVSTGDMTDDPEYSYGAKVAFSAYLGSDLRGLGKGQHVKFNRVLLNDGNGYSPYTGVFRVPYSGVYQFTVVVGLRGAQQTTVRLMSRYSTIMTVVAEGSFSHHESQGSNTIIVYLTKNKTLWVEMMHGDQIRGASRGERPTTFSGFLLYTK